MATRIILDTSTVAVMRKGQHKGLQEILSQAQEVVVPLTVVGELYAGFYGGDRFMQNEHFLEKLLGKPSVSLGTITYETSKEFGALVAQLRKIGTPITTNDVWIAAEARLARGTLVTFDTDFHKIIGLDALVLKVEI